MSNNYIIAGGQHGKSRLNILAGVLEPYTRALLQANGLGSGTALLDAGCGGGHVSLMAAEIAGKAGRVTGVDFDEEIVALARQEAASRAVTNVSFSAGSIYDIPYKDEFDMAYARFLLSHLQQPAEALHKLRDSVKPGGKVIVEDVQFSAHFCYPANRAFDWYVQGYMAAAKQNGQDPEMGLSLFGLFQKAGFADAGFHVIQPAFNNGDGKWMAYITLERIRHALVKQGITTNEEASDMLRQLETFTKDEHSIISMPRIFRVWGTRP